MSDLTLGKQQVNLGAACFRCRGFRHACDRKKPFCSRCHRRGIQCVYPTAAPTLKYLQTATETLSDRIKKFGDRIKTPPATDTMQWSKDKEVRKMKSSKVASLDFSIYPCTKCFKDLQQCDLTQPSCSRCEANQFECTFKKNEPKANHVSQVLATMNTVMDQWQISMDRVSKEIGQRARRKPNTVWRITSTRKGLSVESNVSSYHEFSTLINQVKNTIEPRRNQAKRERSYPLLDDDHDETSSWHRSSFSVWNQWSHANHTMPQDYPIDITQELTDNLIELYCNTPCCSSIRIPILDTTDFLKRYRNPDPTQRPPLVLIYAVCAMAARNAFQLHVWSKHTLSKSESQFTMGKALSVAYCLKGREALSDCFDKATLDHCQAAFLLSYCHYQNGYPGVIYFYEWIAYTMAIELGLFERACTRHESMLVWSIYYFHVWYKTLQGRDAESSLHKPNWGLLKLLKRPTEINEDSKETMDYYVWNTWVYLIELLVLRDECKVNHDAGHSDDTNFLLLVQQQQQGKLKEFHQRLPIEWQQSIELDKRSSFGKYCINFVQLHYNINQISLYEQYIPLNLIPNTPISIQSLEICLKSAKEITQILEGMIKECHLLIVGFVFANIIYRKLLSYPDADYYALGKFGLLKSIEISKASINYKYDFEMARTLVDIMERDIQDALNSVMDSDSSSSSSLYFTIT